MDATGLLKSDTCMHALTALYSTRGRQLKHALFKGGEIRTAIRFLPKACTTADCCDLYGLQKAPAASCSSTGVCSKAASPVSFKLPSAEDLAGLSLGLNSGSTPPLLHAPLPVKSSQGILLG